MKRLVGCMYCFSLGGQGFRRSIPSIVLLALMLPGVDPVAHAQVYWVVLESPTTRDLRKLSFLDNLTGWAVGDSGTILKTTDGAESWVKQTSPVEFDIDDIMMLDYRFGWALAQEYPYDTINTYGTTLIRTTNGGEDWFTQSTFDHLYYHAVEFVDSATGCVGGNQGKLLRTFDGGLSWTPAVIDSPEYARWPILNIKFLTRDYGFASGGLYDVTGLIWKTTDGGNFWTHRRVAGEPIFGLRCIDSANVVCVGGDLDTGAGLVRTSNAGESWEYTYLGIWGQASAVDFRTESEGWAPLAFARTYMYSLDSGRTWTSVYTPDTSALYDVVFTDSTTGYMVGDFGKVLKYVGPPLAVSEPPSAIPDRSPVLQNYPNPFNPTTTIQYDVDRNSLVLLSVYDLTGKLVKELPRGVEAAGTYRAMFNGEGLATGVYLCSVRVQPSDGSPGYRRTMKMLLTK